MEETKETVREGNGTPTRSNHSNASNEKKAKKNSADKKKEKDPHSSNEDFDSGGSGSDEPINIKP